MPEVQTPLVVVVHHLGALHPVEQALTLSLAFGPFVVLGVVIALRRRADERADADERGAVDDGSERAQRDR